MAKSLRILSADDFFTRGRELTWEELDQNFIDLKTDTDNLLPDPTGNNNKFLFVSGDTFVLKEGGASATGASGFVQLSDGNGNLISGDTLFFDTTNKTLVINDNAGALDTSFIIKGQGNDDSTINFLIKNSTDNTLFSFLDNGTLNMNTQSGAFLPPRLTNSQRNGIIPPSNGMFIYNVDTDTFQGYQSGIWDDISGGGSGVPVLTPGSVTFGGAGGILTQDNGSFFWDDTNNRLGIGITTPTARIHIKGISTNNGNSNLDITNSNNNQILSIKDDGTININSGITGAATVDFGDSDIVNISNIGIGTTTLGTNSDKTLTMINGATTPVSNASDTFLMYANDSGVANSSPFFLTENGTVIDIYSLFIGQITPDNKQSLTVTSGNTTVPLTINETTTVIEITLQGNWIPSSITGFIENKNYKFKFYTNGINPSPWQVTFPTDVQRNDGIEPLLKQNTDSSTTNRYDLLELFGKETTSKAQILNTVSYG